MSESSNFQRKLFFCPFLNEVCGSRDHNFNLIRMLAATAVLVSHAFIIAHGTGTPEPFLERLIGRSLGWVAVAVFFVISGFLIARSFDTKSRLIDWGVARFLRIFPGLFVVLLLTTFVMGPLVTTLSLGEYFMNPDTAIYFLRNIMIVSIQYTIPGVFESLPHTGEVNGSLWTLIHEVTCYIGVLVIGVLGMLKDRRKMAVGLAIYLLVYFVTSMPAVEDRLLERFIALRDLSLPFAIGTAFYVWRDKIPLSWWAAAGLGALALFAYETPVFEEFFVLWLSYSVFVVAYLPGGFLRKYNLLGDYSYGFYIYAFPMQQLVVYVLGPMSPWENMLISMPVTLFFAVLSWVWIEKPSLAARHRVAAAVARFHKSKVRDFRLRSPSG